MLIVGSFANLPLLGCHDIQPNDTQHSDIQRNDIQRNDTQHSDIQRNDTQRNDTQPTI